MTRANDEHLTSHLHPQPGFAEFYIKSEAGIVNDPRVKIAGGFAVVSVILPQLEAWAG